MPDLALGHLTLALGVFATLHGVVSLLDPAFPASPFGKMASVGLVLVGIGAVWRCVRDWRKGKI